MIKSKTKRHYRHEPRISPVSSKWRHDCKRQETCHIAWIFVELGLHWPVQKRQKLAHNTSSSLPVFSPPGRRRALLFTYRRAKHALMHAWICPCYCRYSKAARVAQGVAACWSMHASAAGASSTANTKFRITHLHIPARCMYYYWYSSTVAFLCRGIEIR